ncbi:UDP-N-acetylmuramoylalanyl-D-glutamyl-2,6-diaminopimelate--D-alanyl-D-alanine ligase [Aurantimonas sp. MSK8Z-1]|uniref:UDP-N-acetylmuramoylalanyl-D-glutamyl-2, 6-diaminopimelate--D-alanyl-D-alanine ligase n=1 Tax=Mangrovibrevibacter kandeliae TaxID=2968473 RepID=UPI0021173EDB|nr:UDP-N-acetylmuramoylalanyl-D-glutamyl-2,6-diaminopimelate--D-alanyl-D-alanine ligase [Aurantimonas sp. MSK8Z-1]MCW4116677.1 UDP-N-acetylmuramoylalanyl-D-glutamyl-2,6-diaminopimelate--D-alanyl-D-alanine ligase [Aurantimonas sp. MSK8Z-1]
MTAWLWETDALVAALGGRPIGSLPAGITGISIDSRSLSEGEAFFAIKGDRFDGHNFLTAASAAGAGLMVVAERKLPALGRVQAPMIVVEDVLQALVRLGDASRARSKAQIVAVTGSVGKTTTKEALRHALAASGPVHASAASFNNHWGVPLSLARMPAETRYGVFEIGMNHPDEIRPLVKRVRPHVAIVTLIAPAHLGHFASLDAIAVAKAEIFEGVVPGGTALLNADDPQLPRLTALAQAAGVTNVRTFGESQGADVRLTAFLPDAEGSEAIVEVGGRVLELRLAAAGRHIAQNVLAVLGAADLVGADVEAGAAALSTWRAGKGRGARLRLAAPDGEIVLIDESYNANPASMRAAIALLAATEPGEGGRRIAVLGDMLELGDRSAALHAELAGELREAGIDRVHLAGEEMKALDTALAGELGCTWHASTDELGASLASHMRGGDAVMIKASNSIGFARVVERLAQSFAPSAAATDAASSMRQGV